MNQFLLLFRSYLILRYVTTWKWCIQNQEIDFLFCRSKLKLAFMHCRRIDRWTWSHICIAMANCPATPRQGGDCDAQWRHQVVEQWSRIVSEHRSSRIIQVICFHLPSQLYLLNVLFDHGTHVHILHRLCRNSWAGRRYQLTAMLHASLRSIIRPTILDNMSLECIH